MENEKIEDQEEFEQVNKFGMGQPNINVIQLTNFKLKSSGFLSERATVFFRQKLKKYYENS